MVLALPWVCPSPSPFGLNVGRQNSPIVTANEPQKSPAEAGLVRGRRAVVSWRLSDRDKQEPDAERWMQQRCSGCTSGRDRSGLYWIPRSKLRSPFHGLIRTAPRRRRGESDCVAVATNPLKGWRQSTCRSCCYRTRILFGSGLQGLQARLGGVCTGRGLSCGVF